jgi:8-amino-7-oxononanoate synthase
MAVGPLEQRMREKLQSRQERNILRKLSSPSTLIDFSSNDYLSLSKSPHLRDRFRWAISGTDEILGSGGSRLLDGTSHQHILLESRLASFFNAPSALLFNSGFDANSGFFSSVPQKGDAIVYDSFIHASVHDGMRASRVESDLRIPFRHSSPNSLRETLLDILGSQKPICEGKSCVFIAVESLYSMDGDIAPLDEYVRIVESLFPMGNGHLVVDEAHATGIYGPNGRGVVSMLGLESRILVRLLTFGKALASSGGMCI